MMDVKLQTQINHVLKDVEQLKQKIYRLERQIEKMKKEDTLNEQTESTNI
jgi:cell division protein FtsB